MRLTPRKVNEVLSNTCAKVCVEELSLQPDHDFVVKVVQFQELLDVRHRCANPSVVRGKENSSWPDFRVQDCQPDSSISEWDQCRNPCLRLITPSGPVGRSLTSVQSCIPRNI